MGIKKGFRYNPANMLPCSVCGKLLHPSGLKGHERAVHGLHGGPQGIAAIQHSIAIKKPDLSITTIVGEKGNIVKVVGSLPYCEGIVEELIKFWETKYS